METKQKRLDLTVFAIGTVLTYIATLIIGSTYDNFAFTAVLAFVGIIATLFISYMLGKN